MKRILALLLGNAALAALVFMMDYQRLPLGLGGMLWELYLALRERGDPKHRKHTVNSQEVDHVSKGDALHCSERSHGARHQFRECPSGVC